MRGNSSLINHRKYIYKKKVNSHFWFMEQLPSESFERFQKLNIFTPSINIREVHIHLSLHWQPPKSPGSHRYGCKWETLKIFFGLFFWKTAFPSDAVQYGCDAKEGRQKAKPSFLSAGTWPGPQINAQRNMTKAHTFPLQDSTARTNVSSQYLEREWK